MRAARPIQVGALGADHLSMTSSRIFRLNVIGLLVLAVQAAEHAHVLILAVWR